MNHFYKKQGVVFLVLSIIGLSVLPAYNILVRKMSYRDAFSVDMIESKLNRVLYDRNLNFNDEVVITRDFLFLKKIRDNHLIKKHNHLSRFSREKINHSVDDFNTLSQVLTKEETAFLLVIAPNKMSVYSGLFPVFIDLEPDNQTTQYLLELLAENNIAATYLKHVLVEQKNKDNTPLYYKYDTHWNRLGAYYGYKEMIRSLNKIYQMNLKEIEIKGRFTTRFETYDLLKKIRLTTDEKDLDYLLDYEGAGNEMVQIDYDMDLQKISESNRVNPLNIAHHDKVVEVRNKKALNDKKLLYIRDSFATAHITYFQQTFSSVWQTSNAISHQDLLELIEKIKPDIVVYEKVERNFG